MINCWSYAMIIDHSYERLLIIHDQHWSVYHIVTTMGLSKLTHVVQVVPNPPRQVIQDLQKAINHFVWEGGYQKKHVVNEARSQQPLARGGLAVPNVEQFWEGLKCTWIHRLFQSSETSKWRRLALRDLRCALKKPTLDCSNLITESPEGVRHPKFSQ